MVLQYMRCKNTFLVILTIALALSSCTEGFCQVASTKRAPASIDLPGVQRDGSVLLPNQWSLRPAGKQIALGDFPVNIAMHPSGSYVAVLHSGYGEHEVIVLRIPSGKIICRAPINLSFYGIQFSRDGEELYVSGAAEEKIHRFSFKQGYLSQPVEIPLRDIKTRGIAAGLTVNNSGTTLYVASVLSHSVSVVDLQTGKVSWEYKFSDMVTVSATSTNSSAKTFDEASITKRDEAAQEIVRARDAFPYSCVLDEQRNRLYVSLWAQAEVAILDLNLRKEIGRFRTEEHPNELLLSKSGKYLFVANANRNSVSIIDIEAGKPMEILVAVMPGVKSNMSDDGMQQENAEKSDWQKNAPPGNTPNSLAVSGDEKTLYIANANVNAIAVFDISNVGKSRSLGFIPTGWYPTSVRITSNDQYLLVANGKGTTSRANRHGPQPGISTPATMREYIGGLLQGTLSIITLPKKNALEKQMSQWTVTANKGRPQIPKIERTPGHPIPDSLKNPKTPIKYCIYIIKENRTYDQVLGDMPEGNGDSSLCLFDELVTPNHHALAREFVLFDNFYVDGEVSADGHEWSMGAYATDFVEKTWPINYGHGSSGKFSYPSEGNFPISSPAGGYLWDRAREAGVSYRSYGEFVSNASSTNKPNTCKVPSLEGHFDPWYRSFDMDYSDALRADRFLSELHRFENEGEMPRLQIVRLPNDHTSGTTAGKLTPIAYVAENDLALGRIIEGISHSKFWTNTAIFILEDDAQNGPDHVDAHRSIAFVISPYAKRKVVDSTMYSTSSMLRTMELILGLKPMSQFDAAATPMFNAFTATADYRPYQCKPVTVDMTARNKQTAWGADTSKSMDFSKEDAADDIMLNRVIWHSVKGPDVPMPAPKRAAFLKIASANDGDDD